MGEPFTLADGDLLVLVQVEDVRYLFNAQGLRDMRYARDVTPRHRRVIRALLEDALAELDELDAADARRS